MSDLISDIQSDAKLLSKSVSEYRERGIALANAEAEYKSLMAKAMLEERAGGTPATIVRDICLGRDDVATARLNRDCAQALYDSCHEGINALKLQIRINDKQLDREWNQAGRSD